MRFSAPAEQAGFYRLDRGGRVHGLSSSLIEFLADRRVEWFTTSRPGDLTGLTARATEAEALAFALRADRERGANTLVEVVDTAAAGERGHVIQDSAGKVFLVEPGNARTDAWSSRHGDRLNASRLIQRATDLARIVAEVLPVAAHLREAPSTPIRPTGASRSSPR